MDNALNDLKQLLNNGDLHKVRKAIDRLTLSELNRAQRLEIASIARRAGMPDLTIILLNSLVRSAPYGDEATDGERVIYAGALIKLGAVEEALGILVKIDPKGTPEKLYFEAHARMSQWEYGKAIPLLAEYLAAPTLTEGQRISGWLNLAASLVHQQRNEEALPLLEKLETLTSEKGLRVLLGNTLELGAQMAISKKDWSLAENKLNRARALLSGTDSLDSFFVKKWLGILNIARHQSSGNEMLRALREEALLLRHWESVRDCDLRLSVHVKDESLFHRVYFGTPFEAFKKMAVLRYPDPLNLPEKYCLDLGERNGSQYILDVPEEITGNGTLFRPGGIQSRLLVLLLSDFYRPLRVATIFGDLHPEQFFNPVSSPNRVHQSVASLKRLLEERDVPLKIKSTVEGYRLEGDPACRVVVSRHKLVSDSHEQRTEVLRAHFGFESFSIREVSQKLKFSVRSAERLVSKELAKGTLTARGKASSIRYEFTSENPANTNLMKKRATK